jgi:pimeloyl-ACP methyl ester carboxylesterase
MKNVRWLLLAGLALHAAGCGSFMARSMARAPNRYPTWFAPQAPVMLAFNPKLLTNFPAQFVAIANPPARLCYRVIEPADFHFQIASTNWLEHGRPRYEFRFQAAAPGESNAWTSAPRGTVLLPHGYGVAQFSMLPWALRLAQDGWRCVLLDLRGHGKSTGREIYFGVSETGDMIALLDALERDQKLGGPVAMIGESYGAILALRCLSVEPRLKSVVAIAPYGCLSNTVLNIRREYAGWIPALAVKAGLKKLPSLLHIPATEFDTTTVLARKPGTALFVAGGADMITPAKEVEELYSLARPESKFIIVPEATHEALTYYFTDLLPPILEWLANQK